MNAPKLAFPAECPQCLQAAGTIYSASTVAHQTTQIRFLVRCRACEHEWQVLKDVEHPVGMPPPLSPTPTGSSSIHAI